jgi:hypothetical protein
LKKRSKKLLQLTSGVSFFAAAEMPLKNKSFLVLFFKKEHFSFLFFQWKDLPGQFAPFAGGGRGG